MAYQLLFGGWAYYGSATAAGEWGFHSFAIALSIAGLMAVIFAVVAMVSGNVVEIALGTSSLAAILATMCALISLWVVAAIMAFFTLSPAVVAALVAKHEGGARESFPRLFVSALPVIGPVFSFFRHRPRAQNGATAGG